MLRLKATQYRLLLALTVVYCSGCAAECCHLPDDIAYAFAHCQLGREIQDVCNDLNGCHGSCCGDSVACGSVCGERGVRVYEDEVWLDEPPCYEGCDESCRACNRYSCETCVEAVTQRRVQRGPPPVSYVPPMPPKFLPVPARSVFSSSGVAYPYAARGQVEVGYGPQLAFPAGDR